MRKGRGGKVKTANYAEALQAFLLASQITGNERFRICAEHIAGAPTSPDLSPL